MKKLLALCRLFLLVFLLFFSPGKTLFAQCTNADFESGNLTGWTGTWGNGSQRSVAIPLPPPFNISVPYCFYPDPFQHAGLNTGPDNSIPFSTPEKNHFIMTGGYDAELGGTLLPVVYPGGGAYSARLGNSLAQDEGHGGGESLSYTFTVTAANANFTYHYAVVLNDGGHPNTQQPYFKIRMFDGSNNPINCATYDVDANSASTIGGFDSIPASDIFYKPWSSVFIPLNSYIGQTVRIEFSTRDCSPGVDSSITILGTTFTFLNLLCEGSHWAYAYIDAECTPLSIVSSSPAICGGSSITLTGPAGAGSYLWTGPGVVPPGNTQVITITQPGAYHLAMTTLATVPCNFFLDTVILGSPQNPVANFTAPAVCAGNPTAFTDLSTPAGSITSWAWDFDNNGSTDDSTANATHTFAIAGTYPVKLTIGWPPCTHDTTINVVVSPAPTSNFTATTPICTGENNMITYTGNAPPGATYTWNFDGATIVSGSGQGPYVVNWSTPGTPHNVSLTVSIGSCVSAPFSLPVTVNLAPVVTVSGDTSVCTGGSVPLVASGAAVLTWFPTTGLVPPATGPTVTANPVTTTTYIVTGSNAQCTDTASVTVTVAGMPNSFFTAISPICAGVNDTITYTGTAPPGATYTWDFDGGTVVSGTGQGPYLVNWSTSDTVNVSLTVTIGTCISSPTIVPVIVIPSPNVIVSPDVSICTGGSTVLTASGAANLVWTPGTGLNPTSGTNVAANPAVTTTYIVTGNNAQCIDTASVTVTVNAMMTSTFTATSPLCTGQISTITYTGNASGSATYTWNFDGGTIVSGSGQGPHDVNWQTPGTKYLTLTVTENGCISALTSDSVTVNQGPVSDAGADVSFCSGGNAVIGTASTPGYTYSWSPATGLSSATAADPTVDLTNTTNGIVIENYIVTTTGIGCFSTDTVAVTVVPIPVADFISQAGQCLIGNNFTFQAGGSFLPTATFAWSFGSDATPSNSSSQNQNVTFSSPSEHTVSLTITQNGCVSNIYIDSVAIYSMPVVSFSADTLTGCENFLVCFTDNSVSNNPSAYQWDFGDGGSAAAQSPCYTYVAPGTYSVMLQVISVDGCAGTATIPNMITVISNPIAIFSVDNNNVIHFIEETINLLNQSQNAVSYFWTFGNGTTSTETNPTVAYSDSGNYTITLNAYNQLGCVDSTEHLVLVLEPETFYVPNAFTPNGDGVNDVFKVYGGVVPPFGLWVFNRWGEKVFETADPNIGWDGTYKGKPMMPGVYVYYVGVEFLSGQAPPDYHKQQKGSVTLIR